ncbi:transposase (plasmid) [Moraxella osloensis]|uniref:Transposase n=1 Tax=Faucicola osloensis TaxID=34062 RepID=A0A6P1KGT9_FAUOS|nr:transposase [Moraxella osloensis]QHG10871.1 transposase [Moraxella osloensis]QHG10886.1 transposase [Moraxella osloensis]
MMSFSYRAKLSKKLNKCTYRPIWSEFCADPKYGERLKQSGLAASVGTTGDSYDNALAESVNGLYKAEVIDYLKQEWDGVNDVALATLDWVHWYNHERLHSTNGYVSPVDAENIYYCSLIPSGYAA